MTYVPGTYTCDRCADPVSELEVATVHLSVARKAADRLPAGYIAHYHPECWNEARGAICAAIDETRTQDALVAGLERIRTATADEIMFCRGRNRLPDGRLYGQPDDGLRTALDDAKLSAPVRWELMLANITTLDQVAGMSDDELLRLRGIGVKTLAALREAVAIATGGGS